MIDFIRVYEYFKRESQVIPELVITCN